MAIVALLVLIQWGRMLFWIYESWIEYLHEREYNREMHRKQKEVQKHA